MTFPTNAANGSGKTFEVTLTSSLAWVTPDPDKNSVLSVISSTPINGPIKLLDGEVYNIHTTLTPYKPTKTNDFVEVSGGSKITTLTGDDKIISTAGGNTIDAGDGNDVITLGSGNDNVTAGKGNDVIYVTQLNTAAVKVDGGAGVDTLDFSGVTGIKGVTVDLSNSRYHLNNTETRSPIKGIETVIGSSGNDYFFGGKGSEVVNGGAGNDVIFSGWGNDDVDGDDGDDELDGGFGKDVYTGGAGNDSFIFVSIKDVNKNAIKTDVVTDFTRGEDEIDLSFDFDTKKPDIQNFRKKIYLNEDREDFVNSYDTKLFIGDKLFSKQAGEIRYTPVYTDGTDSYIFLQGDTNGDGNADWMIKFIGVSSLSLSDFQGG